MIRRRIVVRKSRQQFAKGPLLAGVGVALGCCFASLPEASASTYRVYTASAASSMTLNANDGFCSLAEAVEHARGNTVYACTDFAPNSAEQRIELLESQNKPYSTNHFVINATLTLSRPGIPIRIVGGSGAFIDSTARFSAFTIQFKSTAYFERVTLTNTAGVNGGRLIENYGNLGLSFVTITKGDVTGPQHTTGRGGGIFNGNFQGFYPALISYAQNSTITGNKARKGGGIYNDAGVIDELEVTISNNTATEGGGGIYNISSNLPSEVWTNGVIRSDLTKIRDNKARAGAGIFNRGLVELTTGSAITGNSTTTTGSSGESCTGSNSCDGLGGGVLTVHFPGDSTKPPGADARFMLQGGDLSNNTASSRGGAVYTAGVLELASNTINGNKAVDGAAIYAVAPEGGVQQYCNTYGSASGTSTINNNIASAGYSIVSGGPGNVLDFRACTFGGLATPGQPTYLTATGNSGPNYCKASALHSSSRCPQP